MEHRPSTQHPAARRRTEAAERWKAAAQSWARSSPRRSRHFAIRQSGAAASLALAFAAIRAGMDPDAPGAGAADVDAAARKVGDLVTAGSYGDALGAVAALASALRSAASAVGADPKLAEPLLSTLNLALQKRDEEESIIALDALLEIVSLPPLTPPSADAPTVALSARNPRVGGRWGLARFAAALPPDISAQLDPMVDLGKKLETIAQAFVDDEVTAKIVRAVKQAGAAFVESAPDQEPAVRALLDAVSVYSDVDPKGALDAIAAFVEATGIPAQMPHAAIAASGRRHRVAPREGVAFGARVPASR